MVNRHKVLLLVLAWAVVLLSGCKLQASDDRVSPEMMYTRAAQTADALDMQRFKITPSPLSGGAPIGTAAGKPSATFPPGSAGERTAIAQATDAAAPPDDGANRADFIADVNIPDGTKFQPGEPFKKTWRITNTGTATWTTDYSLAFVEGDQLDAATTPLPQAVAPGEVVDVSVDMVAPLTPGEYTSYWKLRDANGHTFGLGSDAADPVWVKIDVVDQQPTAGAQTTPAPESSAVIRSVTLVVEPPEFSGACPHTFVFTAQVDLAQAATVSYVLEAGAMGGGSISTPPAGIRELQPGVQALVFEITLPADVSGWARLRVTAPTAVVSNPVNFTLTCQ